MKDKQEEPQTKVYSRNELLREVKIIANSKPCSLDVLTNDELLRIIIWEQSSCNRFSLMKRRSHTSLSRMYNITTDKVMYLRKRAKKIFKNG